MFRYELLVEILRLTLTFVRYAIILYLYKLQMSEREATKRLLSMFNIKRLHVFMTLIYD